MPKPSHKKSFIVIHGSNSKDDIVIPQGHTVQVSNTGLNIIQTPHSPQKGALLPCCIPSLVYEWHPSIDYNCKTANHGVSEDEVVNETEEVPTMAAKVAVKSYPTSVSARW